MGKQIRGIMLDETLGGAYLLYPVDAEGKTAGSTYTCKDLDTAMRFLEMLQKALETNVPVSRRNRRDSIKYN